MTRCNITVTTRVVNPGYRGAVVWEELPRETVAYCTTHHMPLECSVVGGGDLCPIGKIEQATEVALKRIEEAVK